MTFSVALSVNGVHFRLIPCPELSSSSSSTNSSSPIVSVSHKPLSNSPKGSKNDGNYSGGIVANLSQFSGILEISTESSPMTSSTSTNWGHCDNIDPVDTPVATSTDAKTALRKTNVEKDPKIHQLSKPSKYRRSVSFEVPISAKEETIERRRSLSSLSTYSKEAGAVKLEPRNNSRASTVASADDMPKLDSSLIDSQKFPNVQHHNALSQSQPKPSVTVNAENMSKLDSSLVYVANFPNRINGQLGDKEEEKEGADDNNLSLSQSIRITELGDDETSDDIPPAILVAANDAEENNNDDDDCALIDVIHNNSVRKSVQNIEDRRRVLQTQRLRNIRRNNLYSVRRWSTQSNESIDEEDNGISTSHHFTSLQSVFETSLTRLHAACASPTSSIDGLRALLNADPSAACKRDAFNRIPLHLFSENKALALSHSLEEVQLFMQDMIVAYPGCVTVIDPNTGYIPFVEAIANWIDTIHDANGHLSDTFFDERSQSFERRKSFGSHSDVGSQIDEEINRMIYFPRRRVQSTPFMSWSLHLLSFSINHLFALSTENRRGSERYEEYKNFVVERLATIQLMCKTLLLIENDDEVHRIFKMPIILNVILSGKSIDRWLVAMFHAKRFETLRAVTFLEYVSNMTLTDLSGRFKRQSRLEYDSFLNRRKQAFRAVADLKGIIPAMLSLSPKDLEKVATTPVVHYVLEKRLERPMTLTSMLFEVTMYPYLMISYRAALVTCTTSECLENRTIEAPMKLSILVASWFICRDVMTVVALARISRKQARSFFRDWWNYVEFLSMLLVILTGAMEVARKDKFMLNLLAVTLGLQWFKLIAVLKTINERLATFILAVEEIVKDIHWFLMILFIMILMFAEMVYFLERTSDECQHLLYNDGRRFLSDSESNDEFCSTSMWMSVVRAYSIIVGDVNVDGYQTTPFITVLFVFFTFFGVIVGLNILIAVVQASYEKSLEKSRGLFGRTRVEYVGRHIAREGFINDILRSSDSFPRRGNICDAIMNILHTILRWSLMCVPATFAIAANWLAIETCFTLKDMQQSNDHTKALFALMIAALVLFNGVFVFAVFLSVFNSHFGESGWVVRLKNFFIFRLAGRLFSSPLHFFSRLTGMNKSILGSLDVETVAEEGITEQERETSHLEGEIKLLLEETEGRIRAEIRQTHDKNFVNETCIEEQSARD